MRIVGVVNRRFFLSFDITDGDEANNFFAYTRLFGSCDHIVDVLVAGPGLFGQTRIGCTTHIDAVRRHVLLYLSALEGSFGLATTHGPATAVGGGVERLVAACDPRQKIRTTFHAAANNYWLAGFLKDLRQDRVARSEGPRCSFAVDQQLAFSAGN